MFAYGFGGMLANIVDDHLKYRWHVSLARPVFASINVLFPIS